MLRIFRVLSKLLNTSDPNRNSLVRYHGRNTIFQCLNNKELENEDDEKEIVYISEIWAHYGVSLNHLRADHEFKTSQDYTVGPSLRKQMGLEDSFAVWEQGSEFAFMAPTLKVWQGSTTHACSPNTVGSSNKKIPGKLLERQSSQFSVGFSG